VLRRVGARPADDEPRGLARPIFVGHASVLAALAEAAAAARAAGVTVLVHDESGVGKSYLVRHFVDDLTASGGDRGSARVLAGRCYERESVRYEGARDIDEADAWMRAQGVKSPEAVTRLHAPTGSAGVRESTGARPTVSPT
jgi:MoxR-like ATPase